MINNFSISKSKTPIMQKEYCPIILKIIDINIDLADNGLILKLFNHACVEQFKDVLYGEQKQLSIICNGVYKKYLDFQNNEVALHFYSPDNLAEVGSCIAKNDIKHIKIMDTL